jgi:hypothetical protein
VDLSQREGNGMTLKLRIERWHPYRLNQLMAVHWRSKDRMKKADRNIVCALTASNRFPVATTKRRVDLHLTLGPRMREGDDDNWWKSVLDALVHAKMLIDDNRRWCERGSLSFDRGPERATLITLTDI